MDSLRRDGPLPTASMVSPGVQLVGKLSESRVEHKAQFHEWIEQVFYVPYCHYSL
jgi:hypothetical protein